jgi:hypothetical protein
MNKRFLIAIFILSSILLVSISNTGLAIVSNQKSNKIDLTNTTIDSKLLVEGIEMLAGRNGSLITQINSFGGTYTVPFDLSNSAFNSLTGFVLYIGDQHNILKYFPRDLSEIRDGATLVLFFKGISYSTSITNAELIKDAVNSEYSLKLKPLFGVSGETNIVAFYDSFSSTDFETWFSSEYPAVTTGPFISTKIKTLLNDSPVRTTAIVYNHVSDPNFPDGWQIFNSAAFVSPNAIKVNSSSIYNLSLSEVFGLNEIKTLTQSNYTELSLKLPYVANVHSLNPKTNNLYPELTGKFSWPLKADVSEWSMWEWANYDHTYADISVVFDLNITDVENFPQIEAVQSVDFNALTNNNVLNYTITMTNVGTEAAKNLNFLQELGNKGDPFVAPVFNDEVYFYNDSLIVFFDYNNTGWVLPTSSTPSNFDIFNITFVGWFQYVSNGTLVQPVVKENMSSTYFAKYELDYQKTFSSLNINKTILDLSYSSNFLENNLGNNQYGINGTLNTLNPSESETFWWAISNIPSATDLAYVFNAQANVYNITHSYNDTYEVNWYIEKTLNYKDFFFDLMLSGLGDLRFPPGLAQLGIVPGLKFRYEDTASREFFGMSNGLSIQLYDDEAVIVTTVSSDKQIYEAGESVELTFNITNVGNIKASDINLVASHAFIKQNWEFGDVIEFYHNESVTELLPNQSKEIIWKGKADTFLGIHPVYAAISYTTDVGQGSGWNGTFRLNNVLSNFLNVLVIPPSEKVGTDEPSFPTPELNISTSLILPENMTIGDTFEVAIAITNQGDEETHIKAYSYFWNNNVKLIANAYPNVGTINILDEEGKKLSSYSQAYVHDDDFKITYVGSEGITLLPNQTIYMYFTLEVMTSGEFILPPVTVEYDSKYPMDVPSGEEGTKLEDNSTVNYQKLAQNNLNPSFKLNPAFSSIASYTASGNAVEIVVDPANTNPSTLNTRTSDSSQITGVFGFEIYMILMVIPPLVFNKRRK